MLGDVGPRHASPASIYTHRGSILSYYPPCPRLPQQHTQNYYAADTSPQLIPYSNKGFMDLKHYMMWQIVTHAAIHRERTMGWIRCSNQESAQTLLKRQKSDSHQA
jgi:hypothetical protein